MIRQQIQLNRTLVLLISITQQLDLTPQVLKQSFREVVDSVTLVVLVLTLRTMSTSLVIFTKSSKHLN
jgi:hypothetical protein